MTKKLKDYLNKNRHLIEDENYTELLDNCPAEVVAELKLLLADTGAKEEDELQPLDPNQIVAWCNNGQAWQTYLSNVKLTKLSEADISDKFPYTHVLFLQGTWTEVTIWDGKYYIVTEQLKDAIRTHNAEKAKAARDASGVTKYNSYIYRLSKTLNEKTDLFVNKKYPDSRSAEHFVYNGAVFDIDFNKTKMVPTLTIKINNSDKVLLTSDLTMSVPKDVETLVNNKDIAAVEYEKYWEPYKECIEKMRHELNNISSYITVITSKDDLPSLNIKYDTTHCKHNNYYGWENVNVAHVYKTEKGQVKISGDWPKLSGWSWSSEFKTEEKQPVIMNCDDSAVHHLVKHVKDFVEAAEELDKEEIKK